MEKLEKWKLNIEGLIRINKFINLRGSAIYFNVTLAILRNKLGNVFSTYLKEHENELKRLEN